MKAASFLITTVLVCAAPGTVFSQSASSADAVETTMNGAVNWTSGEVQATGIGAAPARPANAAQARAMAERSAFVVAVRNLLEIIKGVRVDSETVVENYITKSDVIRTRVEGIVRGARIVKTQYLSDGSVEITVSIAMKGAFLNAVVPETFGSVLSVQKPLRQQQTASDRKLSLPVPPKSTQEPKKAEPTRPYNPAPVTQPAPPSASSEVEPGKNLKDSDPVKSFPRTVIEPSGAKEPAKPGEEPATPKPDTVLGKSESTVAFGGGVATGLIIDGRGLGLRPALLPRIFDQQGQEVYVGRVVTRTNAVEQGVAGYAKDVNAASNNFRVTDNPAVIKGLSASGAARTDIAIGQADADALRELSKSGDFLQYCRVIIVY